MYGFTLFFLAIILYMERNLSKEKTMYIYRRMHRTFVTLGLCVAIRALAYHARPSPSCHCFVKTEHSTNLCHVIKQINISKTMTLPPWFPHMVNWSLRQLAHNVTPHSNALILRPGYSIRSMHRCGWSELILRQPKLARSGLALR